MLKGYWRAIKASHLWHFGAVSSVSAWHAWGLNPHEVPHKQGVLTLLPNMATRAYTFEMSQGQSMTAAELLRELRNKQGRSLRGAASDIGIAASHLSRIERGERSVTEEVSQRLADYYGISADLVASTNGQIPEDIVAILLRHPELFDQLRKRFNRDNVEDSGFDNQE